jgi:hypothetical protein
VQRFQAERQSLAIMDHPAIAKVFDAGITPQGQPYFVMEYVPGLPITEYCDQKKLKIRERVELFVQACEGGAARAPEGHHPPRLEARQHIGAGGGWQTGAADHRLWAGEGGYPRDRGADAVHTLRPVHGHPGLHESGAGGSRCTGHRQRPSLEEWLRQLREEEPRRPSGKVSMDRETSAVSAAARGIEPKQLASLLRRDLDWIAVKAVERDRERRYGAPSELAADLRRYLNHEPVIARPSSSAYQFGKFIRRHRVAALIAGMAGILAIVTSGAGIIAVRKQHEAQFQALQALQAQSRLLTQAAAQRLKDYDLAGAQDIILEVLTNPAFAQAHTPEAISVFQDIRAADLQLAVLSGHHAALVSAAYSPDGTRIVTASSDKTARIWDARTGAQLAILSGHGGRVYCAAYSPDGMRIVTASYDNTARIWDARSGRQLAVFAGHSSYVRSAAYSPDGAHIITASGDHTARIWDARGGTQLTVFSSRPNLVMSAVYSPDGTQVVTALGDGTARIWEARPHAQLGVISGHHEKVHTAAFSRDGTRIVTASSDRTARLWDARTGAPFAVLSGHGDVVFSAASLPTAPASLPRRRTRPRESGKRAAERSSMCWRAMALTSTPPPTRRTVPAS